MNQNTWKQSWCIKTGRSHTASGQGCQDALILGAKPSVSLVAVLADGLGSRPNSDLASKAVTNTVKDWFVANCDWIGNTDDTVIQDEILRISTEAIAKAAGQEFPDDMDCNLAFVCILLSQNKAICGSLGDCAVCIIDEENPRALTTRGAIANATNTVLSSRNRPEDLKIEIVPLTGSTKGFLLTSDGLEDEVYRKNSGMVRQVAANYFNTVFRGNELSKRNAALERLVDTLQNERGNQFNDDISIAVLSCADGPVTLPADPAWLCSCGHRNPMTNGYCSDCYEDIVKLYPTLLYGCTSMDHMIQYLNRNPEEEANVLGLDLDIDTDTPEPNVVKVEADPVEPPPRTGDLRPNRDTRPAGDQRPGQTGASAAEPGAANPAARKNTKENRSVNQRGPKPSNPQPGRFSSSIFVQMGNKTQLEDAVIEHNLKDPGATPAGKSEGTQESPQNNQPQETGAKESIFSVKKLGGKLLVAIIAVAVIIVVALICTIVGGGDPAESTPAHGGEVIQMPPETTTPVRQDPVPVNYIGKTNSDGEPDGIGARLEDASLVMGNFVDGELHGICVLLENGYYRIGEFDHGEEVGQFWQISASDISAIEEYYPNPIMQDPGGDDPQVSDDPDGEERYEVVQYLRVLVDGPGSRTSTALVNLEAGTIVTATGEEKVVEGGTTWIQVKTELGEIGWCDITYLEPLESEP